MTQFAQWVGQTVPDGGMRLLIFIGLYAIFCAAYVIIALKFDRRFPEVASRRYRKMLPKTDDHG
jgi:hypothetical protein